MHISKKITYTQIFFIQPVATCVKPWCDNFTHLGEPVVPLENTITAVLLDLTHSGNFLMTFGVSHNLENNKYPE